MKRFCFLFFIFSSLFASLFSQSKESDYVYLLDADDPFRAVLYDGQTVKIDLPHDNPFFAALEVKVKQLGKNAARKLFFYSDEGKAGDFYAEDINGKAVNIFVLPLSDEYDEESNAYIKRLDIAAKEHIFLTLEGKTAEVSLRAVLKKSGILRLFVTGGKNPSVFVDDKAVESDWKSGLSIVEGEHYIRVEDKESRSETRRVWIERGKENSLTVKLTSVSPRVLFKAPYSWFVFLDGEIMETGDKEIVISEGGHNVEFRINSYKIQRYFYAKKGKKYSISLETSVMVGEE